MSSIGPTKLCIGPCGRTLSTTCFKPLKSSDPDGKLKARCVDCEKVYHAERRRAHGKPERNLRKKIATEETQECETCHVEKTLNLFPESTKGDGKPQKTCQECSNAVRAKRVMELDLGLREVGDGMSFHYGYDEETGKKLCRICEIWKDRDTEFKSRKDSKYGFCNECRDCRRENIKKHWNDVLKDRRANDPQYREGTAHRGRVRVAVVTKYNPDKDKYLTDCGCSVTFFRAWIESQFDETMTWENYGNRATVSWSMDHYLPLVAFDLTDPTQKYLAFSWLNFQPCFENSSKGVTIPEPADFIHHLEAGVVFANQNGLTNVNDLVEAMKSFSFDLMGV